MDDAYTYTRRNWTNITGGCFSSHELLATCGGAYAGTCVSMSCECREGWDGHSDFITMDLTPWGGRILECPSLRSGLLLLWMLPLLPCLVAIFLVAKLSRERWKGGYENNSTKKFAILVLIVSVLFSCIAMCLLKIFGARHQMLVGIHVAPTFLYSITCVLAFVTLGFFHSQHFDLILSTDAIRGRRPDRSLVETDVQKILLSTGVFEHWPQILLNTTLAVTPFFGTPSEGQHDLKRVFFVSYVGLNCVCSAIMAFKSWKLKNFIRTLFVRLMSKVQMEDDAEVGGKHENGSADALPVSSSRTTASRIRAFASVRDQLLDVQNEVVFHCCVHVVVKSIFLFVPQFHTKASYVLPFSFFSFAFVVVRVLKMILTIHYRNRLSAGHAETRSENDEAFPEMPYRRLK